MQILCDSTYPSPYLLCTSYTKSIGSELILVHWVHISHWSSIKIMRVEIKLDLLCSSWKCSFSSSSSAFYFSEMVWASTGRQMTWTKQTRNFPDFCCSRAMNVSAFSCAKRNQIHARTFSFITCKAEMVLRSAQDRDSRTIHLWKNVLTECEQKYKSNGLHLTMSLLHGERAI